MKTGASKGVTSGSFPRSMLVDSEEWKALSLHAQVLYYVLWLDDASTHLGTRRFHPTALTKRLPGLDEDAIVAAAAELASEGWIALDEEDQLVHLRGWIARDGVTTSPKMAWAFRSAWDVIESPVIRESVVNDLRLSYDIDRESYEVGHGLRTRWKRRSEQNKPKDPDAEGAFWKHDHLAEITAQMPDVAQSTPLDGTYFDRMLPLAFGRGDGRSQFARLGYLNMWAFLTLYLRADAAGVVEGNASRMLSRRATGPEMTTQGMKVAIRGLAQNGWIETDSGDSGDALRIRFFHLHDGSIRQAMRGTKLAGETQRIESDRLRAGVVADLALAFTLGLGTPKAGASKSFWHTTAKLWDEEDARPRTYDADDLTEHCIGPALSGWTGKAPAPGLCGWVPRHAITAPGSTLTDRPTDTLTNTLTNRPTDTLTKETPDGTFPHEYRDLSGSDTLTHTVTDRPTDTLTDTPYVFGVQGLVFGVQGSGFAAPPAAPDGRTDIPSSDPVEAKHLASAKDWVADLGDRPEGQRIEVGDTARLTALVASHFAAGKTDCDLDALVEETLDRGVASPAGYLMKVLEDPHRQARPRPGDTFSASPRGSAANAGAIRQQRRNNPFAHINLEGDSQ